MTGTWRDTVFIWSGTLTKNENLVWQFQGHWIGVEDSPDARTAPTPTPQAFSQSDVTFKVVSKLSVLNQKKTAAAHKKEDDDAEYFSYDMTGGNRDHYGWDLQTGQRKTRHCDRQHTLLCQVDWEHLDEIPHGTLVVAHGTNEFGPFLSAGYIDTQTTTVRSSSSSSSTRRSVQLILARRYLEDHDVRAKWSLQEVYDKVQATDGGVFELRHVCDSLQIRKAPWRTMDLHAETMPTTAGKRKRHDDTSNITDNEKLPPLVIPNHDTFDPTLRLDMTRHAVLGTMRFQLVSQVQWLGQCYGCGTCMDKDASILYNDVMIYSRGYEIADPETDFYTYYCSPECIKKQGAKAWADASRIWHEQSGDFRGYYMQGGEEEAFWRVIEKDPKLVQMMTSVGWEGPGEWRLEPKANDDSEEEDGGGGGDY